MDDKIKIKDLNPISQNELKEEAVFPISQGDETYKSTISQVIQKVSDTQDDKFFKKTEKIPNENLTFGEIKEGDSNVVSGGDVFFNLKKYSDFGFGLKGSFLKTLGSDELLINGTYIFDKLKNGDVLEINTSYNAINNHNEAKKGRIFLRIYKDNVFSGQEIIEIKGSGGYYCETITREVNNSSVYLGVNKIEVLCGAFVRDVLKEQDFEVTQRLFVNNTNIKAQTINTFNNTSNFDEKVTPFFENKIYNSAINTSKNIEDIKTIKGVFLEFNFPNVFYAVKGVDKSIYLNCLTNINDDCPAYTLQVNKSFGSVDLKHFYFNEAIASNKSIDINAYNFVNEKIKSKKINIEIIDPLNVISKKNVMCIGDSITEAQNLPFYLEEKLKNILGDKSPNFLGTKGGLSGMAGKPTKHEGYYGRDYTWLTTSNASPFVENGVLNIRKYIADNSYSNIDVISLGMGFNGTETREKADSELKALVRLINAFKDVLPKLKVIVQMVTYPATGNVMQVNGEERTVKKSSLDYFRKICLKEFEEKNDTIIGDMGIGYDRWLAYPKKTYKTHYYEEVDLVITDRVHPTENGAKQIGENLVGCFVKQLIN